MPPRKRGIYRDGYFKVSRRLVDSSLWCESSDVLKVFFFLLERAQDPGGPRDGTVFIARKQLAAKCLMSPEALDTCLSILSAPDPQSRTSSEDGRRIEVLPNGYRVVNYGLYHDRAKDEMVSRARSAAGRAGGANSAKGRSNQHDSGKQNPTKDEANPSNGDGDGDGDKTDTTTTPPTPQRGGDRKKHPPTGKPSWSSEAVEIWSKRYGGANAGKMLRHLKPVVDRHGWEDVRPAWEIYVETADPQYATAAAFSEKPSIWLDKARARSAPPSSGGEVPQPRPLRDRDDRAMTDEEIARVRADREAAFREAKS